MIYFLSISRVAYMRPIAKTNLLHLIKVWIMLLGVLGMVTWVQAGTVTSAQQTSVPNASTDPNQPSIYDTNGIPNSGLPTQGNKPACNNPEGNPNGCGESNIASQGNQSQTNAGVGNPINVITGNKYQREDDMPALPGIMGIEIVRHYNSLHMGLGQIGYGWRLSYETDLQIVRNQIYIHQADGSRVIFNRSSINPSDCACQNPAQGHVMIYHTPKGDEYTWYWLDGKQLHFNHQGKLTRISAPTGESVRLTRGLRGELLKVTDPQGRSLVLHYADQHQHGFKGIVAIDTPVGRYQYHHDNDPKSAGISNLIRVEYPQVENEKSQLVRHYLYGEPAYVSAHMLGSNRQPAIPHASHLLTGIQLAWQAGKVKQQQRLRTWAYDAYGRGVLSVHGLPKQIDINGKAKAGTGIEQVNLTYAVSPIQTPQHQTKQHHSKPTKHSTRPTKHSTRPTKHSTRPTPSISNNGQLGQTVLTNSLEQTTTYNYTLIAGEPRLLQVVGAGCAECGETNRVYGYDKFGRLSHNTQVKVIISPATAAKTPKLQGLQTTYTEYDPIGRPIRISNIGYINGKAQAPTLKVRYAYVNTPSFPQLNSAPRAVEEPVYVANKPSLIAIPSVVAGKERQWHITYNQHGQPTKVTELGYRPSLIGQHEETPTPISRTITYRYRTINNRSLLVEVDGPLPNGNSNTPKDSDITQYQYDTLGQYLTKIAVPGNITTRLSYDLEGARAVTGGTGRLLKKIESNLITTEFTYNQFGKITHTQRYPASLNLASAKEEGLLQSTAMAYDLLGNTTMIKRPEGQAIHLQYSLDGRLIKMRDALGNRVEWKGWEKAKHQQDETVTTQQWYTADAPNTVARAWYFWRDDQNRLTQRLSPDGGLDTWQYSQGNATNLQNQWVQHIDPLNRMTLSAASNQGYAQVRMAPDGYMDANFSEMVGQERVQTVSKQSNSQPVQPPLQIQDDFGRIIRFSSAQHGTHTAEYSADNRITHILQPDGTNVDYIYDVAGRLLQKSAKNKQVTKSDGKNVANNITYQYDAFGLKVVTDGMQTTQYTKDALGREVDKSITLTMQNKASHTYHIRTRYDAKGRIKAKQIADGNWLVFSLDKKTGLTNAMTLHDPIWPSLTNKLADWFNAPDLPLQIATKETVVTDIKVHPFNGITHLTHGNGINSHYGFDLAGRLITVQHGKGAVSPSSKASVMQASYQYDAGRRLVAENISVSNMPEQAKEYAYQAWNQLATAPKAGYQNATFTRPTALNTNAIKPNQTSAATSIATAQTQPAQVPEQPQADVQIDQSGRVINDAQYRYQYQAWGRLSTVSNPQGKPLVHYAYNAWGERIMAQANHDQDNTRYYLYDHQQRVAELDAAGNITQQYFYVNGMPVAVKNTPSSAQKSKTKPAQLLAVHTDRRHAPVAVTDESGKVIWQAGYDAWGRASVSSPFKGEGKVSPIHLQANQSNNANNFSLALRLPGQWEDETTHIHYNYQRDYNPDTGRYLIPDPLGFPDGLDPYAYVNNDPLNKLDPLGLYEIDVHYYMTYFLGVMSGLTEYQAHVVALGAQYVDDNLFTQPLPHSLTQAAINIALENPDVVNRLESYHFTQHGYDPVNPNPNNTNFGSRDDNPEYVRDRIKIPRNPQLSRLLVAANANYKGAPCKTIKEQLFGEYLHAFEDTFGHRDQLNAPISINVGFGHGSYLHEPDKTYNDVSQTPTSAFGYWYTREARTLEMEKEVFAQIQKNFGVQGRSKKTNQIITIDGIMATLEKFNKIRETEETTNNLFAGSEKLKVLNDFLTRNGFRNIPTYNITQACKFRQNTITEIAGNPPAGVILGTPLNCTAARGE